MQSDGIDGCTSLGHAAWGARGDFWPCRFHRLVRQTLRVRRSSRLDGAEREWPDANARRGGVVHRIGRGETALGSRPAVPVRTLLQYHSAIVTVNSAGHRVQYLVIAGNLSYCNVLLCEERYLSSAVGCAVVSFALMCIQTSLARAHAPFEHCGQ